MKHTLCNPEITPDCFYFVLASCVLLSSDSFVLYYLQEV